MNSMRLNNKALVRYVWKILISFILTIVCMQCSMNSGDIRKGEYLERAKETSVDDFFEKRMQNRIKKVLGANWEILFESTEFVYFGYPLISFFREGTFLDEFFKVKKVQIELDFPSYKNFDGIEMKKLCYESMNEFKQVNRYPSTDCKAKLEINRILVYANLSHKVEQNQYKTEKYLIEFDKKNLKRQSINKLEE